MGGGGGAVAVVEVSTGLHSAKTPRRRCAEAFRKFTPSRPQSYAIFALFALITPLSTRTSHQSHASSLQNFETHAEDLRRNPYKMKPGVSMA